MLFFAGGQFASLQPTGSFSAHKYHNTGEQDHAHIIDGSSNRRQQG
jgi:hypothetical protein